MCAILDAGAGPAQLRNAHLRNDPRRQHVPVIAEFPRNLAWSTPGGFLSYGAQPDLDAAFDDASLADQFDLGTIGAVPSLYGCDPNLLVVNEEALHPHVALRKALADLPGMEPGQVTAQKVRALKDFSHARHRSTVEDPTVDLPSENGFLWGYEDALAAAAANVQLEPGQVIVSGEMPRVGTRRFQAKAVTVPGPKVTTFGVFDADDRMVGEHPNASLARKDALERARDKQAGAGRWEIRPVVRKADRQPHVLVTRTLVACKVPVVVHTAVEKDPSRVTAHGYLFIGRRSG